MSLRITDKDQLEKMTPWARKQLEQHLDMADVIPSDEPHFPGKVIRITNRPEEDAGRALTAYMDALVLPNGLRPGLYFFHVPNGLARTAAQGGIFKAQGLRKGWPDYGLDLPLGGFHGARLELKSEQGAKPGPEQLEILARLESVGYRCGVAWGFVEARKFFDEYLDLAR